MKKPKVIFAFLLILCGCGSSDETFVDTPTTDEEEITDDSTKIFKTEYADGEYTQPLYFGFELTDRIANVGWLYIKSLDNRLYYDNYDIGEVPKHLLPSIDDPTYEWKKKYVEIQKINETISEDYKYYLVSNFTFSVLNEHKIIYLYNIKQNDIWRIWRGHEVPYVYKTKHYNGIVLDEEVRLEDIMPTDTATSVK